MSILPKIKPIFLNNQSKSAFNGYSEIYDLEGLQISDIIVAGFFLNITILEIIWKLRVSASIIQIQWRDFLGDDLVKCVGRIVNGVLYFFIRYTYPAVLWSISRWTFPVQCNPVYSNNEDSLKIWDNKPQLMSLIKPAARWSWLILMH